MQEPIREQYLKVKLQSHFRRQISLSVKNNRSVFLSVKSTRNMISISLNRVFLYASDDMLNHLINYIKNKDRISLAYVNHFVDENISKVIPLKKININTKGDVYDLKSILQSVNDKYFLGKVEVNVTWGKRPKYKRFSHITFASYDRYQKLIRVNKILDNSYFPYEFVEFILYHEMLHHVMPVSYDKKQRRQHHGKNFRLQERAFENYDEMKKIEKNFLKKGKGLLNGRT